MSSAASLRCQKAASGWKGLTDCVSLDMGIRCQGLGVGGGERTRVRGRAICLVCLSGEYGMEEVMADCMPSDIRGCL
jgi:hypothetical protein